MKEETGKEIVSWRHPEWAEHQLRWRWLLDSLEGGDRYRYAEYGADRRGFAVRNLVRHKREYPGPGEQAQAETVLPIDGIAAMAARVAGAAMAQAPTDDDYTLRLVRTPVPDFVAEVVRKHLARIYRREPIREGPDAYLEWAEDVDGTGLPLDEWMKSELAPLLLTLGCLDVLVDHPSAPEGEEIRTEADSRAAGLDRVEARLVMPWDVLWWELDERRRYRRVLVLEHPEDDDEECRYRLWTAAGWTLYDEHGKELERGDHPYGIVPMERYFIARKHRCRHVGQSPVESVAERQREYYNRDSELILSDVLQAHPLLQGPDDAVAADGSIAIGPGWLLPKKKTQVGTSVTYEGFETVDFGKGGAESIRTNLQKLRDEIDRSQAMSKPAGADAAATVAQSGLSKGFDYVEQNDLLADLADVMARVETAMGRLVATVAGDGKASEADLASVSVSYSKQFDLLAGEDLAARMAEFEALLDDAGRVPEVELEVLDGYVRNHLLPGRPDPDYAKWRAELEEFLNARQEERLAPPDPTMDPFADPARTSDVPPKNPPRPDARPDLRGRNSPAE